MNRTALAVAAAASAQPSGARPIAERFWEKVDKSGGPDACWPWTATKNRLGYGQFAIVRHQPIGAHRMAWVLAHGDPGDLHVMHSCDNPPCCNPAHLSLGTHKDNLRDSSRKGRMHQKLTDVQVIAMRERSAGGESAAALARVFGVEYSTAKKIVAGRLRPFVGGPTRNHANRTCRWQSTDEPGAAFCRRFVGHRGLHTLDGQPTQGERIAARLARYVGYPEPSI